MDPKELTRQPPAVTDNPYAKLLKGKVIMENILYLR